MKRVLTTIVLLFSLTTMARADEASRRVKVAQLIEVMHLSAMTDQMMALMKAQVSDMRKMFPSDETMTPEQEKLVQEFSEKSMDLAIKTMGWKALEPDIIDIYAKNFSDDEVDAMLKFYSSPVGQSVLSKMPQMTTAMMTVVQQKMVTLQPQVKALTEEYKAKVAAAASASTK